MVTCCRGAAPGAHHGRQRNRYAGGDLNGLRASQARGDSAARVAKRVVVAYDVHLADRVRELLVDGSPVTEQSTFGGLAFLLAGKKAVAASSQGGLLVLVDPPRADLLLATTNAWPMEMSGRVMRGWLHVGGDDLCTERELVEWTAIGTATARDAPAKGPTR